MTVVCIAGMHRSGTSMVTELLQSCGLYLGPDDALLPPNIFNAEGYFENREFYEINESLLSLANATWEKPPDPSAGLDTGAVPNSLLQQAEDLVQRLNSHPVWGWKDPRNCFTLPFWRMLVPNLKVVCCLRNPLEVARSLANRNHFTWSFSFDLWHVYNQRLLEHTEQMERLTTHYDAYFVDPRSELRRLIDFIGMDVDEGKIEKACGSALQGLRHNRSTLWDLIEADPPLEVLDLYAQMSLRAGTVYGRLLENPVQRGSPEAPGNRETLSERDLQRMLSSEDPWLQALASDYLERERVLRALKLQIIQERQKADETERKSQEKFAELERRAAEQDDMLHEILISKAWRAALLLRRLAAPYHGLRRSRMAVSVQRFLSQFR